MGTAPVTAVKHHRERWRFHKTSVEAIFRPFKTSTTNVCGRHTASSRITAAWHTLVECRHLWFCFSLGEEQAAGHQLKKVVKLNHEVLWVWEAVETSDRYLVPWRAAKSLEWEDFLRLCRRTKRRSDEALDNSGKLRRVTFKLLLSQMGKLLIWTAEWSDSGRNHIRSSHNPARVSSTWLRIQIQVTDRENRNMSQLLDYLVEKAKATDCCLLWWREIWSWESHIETWQLKWFLFWPTGSVWLNILQ